MRLPRHLDLVEIAERNASEWRELSRITGRTVAELDADLTAPDPGGDTMHALSQLWLERRPRIDRTVYVNGHRMDVDAKTQVGTLHIDGTDWLVMDHYCAYCARTDPAGSHDGEARCEHKAALDETLGDLYSGGMDAMLADYADDLDTRLAAVRGVL